MKTTVTNVWVGVDAGKTAHHCVVIDGDGQRLLSRRINNDENEILTLIEDAAALADGGEMVWATDLNSGGAALLLAHLVTSRQPVFYIPGRVVYHASAGYRGEGKTDAKDAAIIADQARMRRDLHPVRVADDTAAALRILTGHRTDPMRDRTRTINRIRALLSEFFPALERALNLAQSKENLILLTEYQTPNGIRRCGRNRLEARLRKHGAYQPAKIADIAVTAARQTKTTVTRAGRRRGNDLIPRPTCTCIGKRTGRTGTQIAAEFERHPRAEILTSMPGIGPLLGAEFLAATGGDLDAVGSPDRLAALSGLAPVPRDSGRISGNLHRPRRYDRRLMRVFYLSAQISLNTSTESQTYYQRKRKEGKRHVQAVIVLARRRINVLWAMLRDNRPFESQGQPMPATAA